MFTQEELVTLRHILQSNTPIRTGYLRGSILITPTEWGATVTWQATYAGYLEYGTKHFKGHMGFAKTAIELAQAWFDGIGGFDNIVSLESGKQLTKKEIEELQISYGAYEVWNNEVNRLADDVFDIQNNMKEALNDNNMEVYNEYETESELARWGMENKLSNMITTRNELIDKASTMGVGLSTLYMNY